MGVVYFAKNARTTEKAPVIQVLSAHEANSTPREASKSPSPSREATSSFVPTLASGYCLNVPVLMYHHIEPSTQAKAEGHSSLNVDSGIFASQMAYLSSKGYNTITADDLVNALKRQGTIPSKSIVLTFDDGYSDFYTYAFPVIKQYNFKANLMIPTGLIQNNGYMTWGQLQEISSSGSKIYNHTWSHASLGGATIDKITYEISTANKQISQYLGYTPDIFTYPYGSEGSTVINYLVSQGFRGAFSEIPGTYQCDSYLMTLHRTRIGNSQLSAYGI